jgi:hypothetical protein
MFKLACEELYMKKSTLQHVLPLAVLMVSTAMITACEKGGARTPEGAIVRAKCERGFNTSVENQKLVETLSKNTNVQSDIAIRTYITKFVEDKTKPNLLNSGNARLVSVQKADVFASSPESDAINVITNCEKLTATVTGPNGLKIENLTIKDVKMQSIELTRSDLTAMEDMTVNIEKAARLQAHDQALKAQIDDKTVTKGKKPLKDAMKSIKERQMSRGNVVTTLKIEIKGSSTQSYVIEQHSGEIFDDAKIIFEDSVVKMIDDRTKSVGTPDFIQEIVKAIDVVSALNDIEKGVVVEEERLDLLQDKLTGEKINMEKAKINYEKVRTINEADAVTELREKLEAGAGLAVSPKAEATTVAATPASESAKKEEKKPEESTLVPSEVIESKAPASPAPAAAQPAPVVATAPKKS